MYTQGYIPYKDMELSCVFFGHNTESISVACVITTIYRVPDMLA